MRTYVEAYELVEEGGEGDFIRLDATSKDLKEVAEDVKALLNPLKRYRIVVHRCLHDQGGVCEVFDASELEKEAKEPWMV